MPSRITSSFPLKEAMLCLNRGCEAISNTKTDHCPSCGKRGLMPLATILGTINDEPEVSIYPTITHFTGKVV